MKQYGYLIGALSGLLWGVVSILYGFIDTTHKVFNILLPFTIDLLGLLVCGGYILFRYKSEIKLHKSMFIGLLSGMIGGPIGMLCYIYAIQNIGAEYSASISSTYPILCTLFFLLTKKESANSLKIIGILMATICSVLLGIGSGGSINYNNGIWFAVITALCWSTEIILSSNAMTHYNATFIYFFRQMGSVLGYGMVLMYLFYSQGVSLPTFDYNPWVMLGIIVFSILSYYLYYQAIYLIPPISALALNITYNIWTIIFSIILSGSIDSYIPILLCLGVSVGSLLTTIKTTK